LEGAAGVGRVPRRVGPDIVAPVGEGLRRVFWFLGAGEVWAWKDGGGSEDRRSGWMDGVGRCGGVGSEWHLLEVLLLAFKFLELAAGCLVVPAEFPRFLGVSMELAHWVVPKRSLKAWRGLNEGEELGSESVAVAVFVD
jgi:hypothetical protein